MPQRILKLLSVHFLVTCLLLASSSQAETTINLGRYWLQDRFIRTMAYTLGQKPEDQLKLLTKALELSDRMNQSPTVTKEVSTLAELDQVREEYFRSELTLQEEMEKIHKRNHLPANLNVVSKNPEVEKALTEIVKAYREVLDRQITFPPKAWWASLVSGLGIMKQEQVNFFDLLAENSTRTKVLLKGARLLPQGQKLEMIEQFNEKIRTQLSSIDQVATNALATQTKKFKDPLMATVTHIVLTKYFAHLTTEEKLELAFAIMQKPEDMTTLGIFGRVGRKVGPNFQKLFQMISRHDGFSPELREIFISFEDSLPPAPRSYVEMQLEKLKKRTDFKILEFEMEPRRVGTMAQVHYSRLLWKDGHETETAQRIVKPIHEKLRRELAVFRLIQEELLRNPDIRRSLAAIPRLIEDQGRSAMIETDSEAAAVEQQKGFESYTSESNATLSDGRTVKVQASVPQVQFTEGKDILGMEWVHGESLDEVRKKHPELLKTAVEAWSMKWFETAFFGGGFIHADTHAGNIGFSIVNEDHIRPWIFDYGMTTQIDHDLQLKFTLLAIANYSNSDVVMARTMLDLSETKDLITAEELTKRITEERARLATEGKTPQLNHWMQFGFRNGLSFPFEFSGMVRGLVGIMGVLKDVKSDFTPGSIVRQILMNRPDYLYRFRSLPTLIHSDELWSLGSGMVSKNIGNMVAAVTPDAAAEMITSGKKIVGDVKDLGGSIWKKLWSSPPAIQNTIAKSCTAALKKLGDEK